MTEITRLYQFIVYQTDGTTPDLTFNDNAIVVPPVYGGWRVNPLEGTSVSEPFPVQILDTSEQVTSNLSDASGRADLIGRVWEIKINQDGGGLVTRAKGRVVGVDLGSDIVSYIFQCGDERFFTRGIELFTEVTATTTQLWPAGLRATWNQKPKAPLGKFLVGEVTANEVLFVIRAEPGGPASTDILEWIRNDLLPSARPGSRGGTSGSFNHLRFNIDGTDREILSFNQDLNWHILGSIRETEERSALWPRFVHIAWPSSGLSEDTIKEAFFHAPSAPASETLPFHIGGDLGVDLMSWLKDQYDAHSIRYDSDAFSTYDKTTNPDGLLDHPLIPDGVIRVTGPERLSAIEDKLFKSYGLAPFPNAVGEITPRFVTLPHDIDPSALTQITSAKLRLPHPTFAHGLEMVTVIQGVVPSYWHMTNHHISDERSWPADRVRTVMRDVDEVTHDRIADLGRHVHRIELFGITGRGSGDGLIRQQATELFDRYGDGRIRGTFHGLSALDDVLPGDYVILNLSSYPDLATQTRAGLRLVQILERRMSPFGGEFEYIDVGADDQPVAAPAVAIIQNTSRTKHDVDITISALPAGHKYQAQIKVGSENWRNVQEGTANETFTIRNLPSNTAIQARARSTKTGVVRSPWTDPAASVTTAALGVASGLSASISGSTVALTWTNGETIYDVMPTIGGVNRLLLPLPAESTRFVFTDQSGELSYGVKYVDGYGGEGAVVAVLATAAAATTLTAPRAIVVLQGAPASGDTVHPEENRFGAGIEIRVHRLEPLADTEIQVDDNGSFTSPDTYVLGSVDSLRIPLPLDNTTRYIRARHTREGWTASDWTGTVTAKPVPFAEEAGVSDGFAGGSASLSFDAANFARVFVNVDSEDPDTDRAYYVINKTGFVEPTTGSTEVTRADMPANTLWNVSLTNLDTVYLWLKFYNDLKGFGQGVKITLPMIGLIDYKPIVDVAYVLNQDPTDTVKMTVTVEDRHLTVTTIKYRLRTEDGSLGSFTDVGWDTSTGTIGVATALVRAESVAVGPGKNSEIHYQIIWVDEEGNSQTIAGSSSQAHLEALTKTIKYPVTSFTPWDDSQRWGYAVWTIAAGVSGDQLNAVGQVFFPPGVTITKWEARGRRQVAGDKCDVKLYRILDSGGASLISTLSLPAGGVSTVSAVISEAVGTDGFGVLAEIVYITGQTDGALFWLQFTYTVPSYADTI